MSENGRPGSEAAAERLLEEVRAIAEKAREPRWVNADGLAAHWGNVYRPKTIRNRSAPSVPPEDRIPSHVISPGGERMYHVPECDEWLLGRRVA